MLKMRTFSNIDAENCGNGNIDVKNDILLAILMPKMIVLAILMLKIIVLAKLKMIDLAILVLKMIVSAILMLMVGGAKVWQASTNHSLKRSPAICLLYHIAHSSLILHASVQGSTKC